MPVLNMFKYISKCWSVVTAVSTYFAVNGVSSVKGIDFHSKADVNMLIVSDSKPTTDKFLKSMVSDIDGPTQVLDNYTEEVVHTMQSKCNFRFIIFNVDRFISGEINNMYNLFRLCLDTNVLLYVADANSDMNKFKSFHDIFCNEVKCSDDILSISRSNAARINREMHLILNGNENEVIDDGYLTRIPYFCGNICNASWYDLCENSKSFSSTRPFVTNFSKGIHLSKFRIPNKMRKSVQIDGEKIAEIVLQRLAISTITVGLGVGCAAVVRAVNGKGLPDYCDIDCFCDIKPQQQNKKNQNIKKDSNIKRKQKKINKGLYKRYSKINQFSKRINALDTD